MKVPGGKPAEAGSDDPEARTGATHHFGIHALDIQSDCTSAQMDIVASLGVAWRRGDHVGLDRKRLHPAGHLPGFLVLGSRCSLDCQAVAVRAAIES